MQTAPNQTPNSMAMPDMMDMMVAITYFCFGVYCLSSYFLLRKRKVLVANKILYPRDCDPARCRKPEAFISFILPRVLLLGVVLVLFGGLFLLDHFVGTGSPWLTLVTIFLPLAFFAWYVREQRKATQRFW